MVFGTRSPGRLQQVVGKGALSELSPWQHKGGHNKVTLVSDCYFYLLHKDVLS